MLQTHQSNETLHFGQWCFNPQLGELISEHNVIRIEPQVAKVLSYFYFKQNELISKDELISELWDNRVVSDDAVTRCISNIRQVLSPTDRNAIIKTIPRRGFIASFPAPLTSQKTQRNADLEHTIAPHRKRGFPPIRKILLLILFIFFAVALLFLLIPLESNSEIENNSVPVIAILPFSSNTIEGKNEFLAKGLHSELLAQLSKVRNIRVISNTAIQDLSSAMKDEALAGQSLNADYILNGNIQIINNIVRTNVSLNQVSNNEQLWSDTYQSKLTITEIFQIYGEIANAIATEINIELSTADTQEISHTPTQNMAAYRIYRKVIDSYEAGELSAHSPELMNALEEAVQLDPSFARAWSEIASIASLLSYRNDNAQLIEKAENAIEKLQRLSPNSVDYFYAKATFLYYVLKDLDTAYTIIRQVVSLNPSNTRALLMQSYIERRLGLNNARIDTLKALRQLEPRNARIAKTYLYLLMSTRNYEQLKIEFRNYNGPVNEDIEKLENILAFKEHKSLIRLLENMQASCQYTMNLSCTWEALLANRQYDQALNILSRVDLNIDLDNYHSDEVNKMLTLMLVTDRLEMNKLSEHWLRNLDTKKYEKGIVPDLDSVVAEALALAMLGDVEIAKEHILRFRKISPVDLADQYISLINVCRTLAIIGATNEALSCLQEALDKSVIKPMFFEHHMPFYDGIRDSLEFQNLLIEMNK